MRAVIRSDIASLLQHLMLLDRSSERLIFRAVPTEEGIVLAGCTSEFDELLDEVAAEANHEPNPGRRRRLDDAFGLLSDAIMEKTQS